MTAPVRSRLDGQGGLYGPVRNWMRRSVAFVDHEDTLDRVAQVMKEGDMGAVVVLGPRGPDAIITESDLVNRLAQGHDVRNNAAGQVGTTNLVAADAGDRALEVANAMLFHGIHHVVVREGSDVVGVVCASDLLAAALLELADTNPR